MSDPRDDLDDRVRAHYQGQALDEGALRRMRSALETRSPVVLDNRVLRVAAAVVIVTLILVIGRELMFSPGDAVGVQDSISNAARQIAANHIKNEPATFAIQDFEALAAPMSRLGFRPRRPIRNFPADCLLEGARYCSIDGAIAALLRIRDGRGRRLTLYQFRASEIYAGMTDVSIDVDGITVTLWEEEGVVLGLAADAR